MTTRWERNELIDEIKIPLSKWPHGLDWLERLRWDVLQMSMLLILDIFLDIISTITFHGRLVIIHSKDTFSDNYTIEMYTTNIIMTLRYYDLLIVKLEKMKKGIIKGLLIEDIPQYHVASSLMFKYMLLSMIHINGKIIQLEILI